MAPLSNPVFSVLTTAVAAGVGYYIGKASGLQTSSVIQSLQEKAKAPSAAAALDDEFHPIADEPNPPAEPTAADVEWEDSEDSDDGGVSTFTDMTDECKMVFVVRTDLGMTKGKIAAQCGHATLMCYKAALRHAPGLVRRWETYGQTKVAVQVREGGEEELLMLQAKALGLGVVAKVVHDAGRTQIAAGSATVLGLGPGPKSVIDQISGGLKLL